MQKRHHHHTPPPPPPKKKAQTPATIPFSDHGSAGRQGTAEMRAAQKRQRQCWTKVFSDACTSAHPANEVGSTSAGQCKCPTQCQGRARYAHAYRYIPPPALQHQHHSGTKEGMCSSCRAILAHQFKRCWTVLARVGDGEPIASLYIAKIEHTWQRLTHIRLRWGGGGQGNSSLTAATAG